MIGCFLKRIKRIEEVAIINKLDNNALIIVVLMMTGYFRSVKMPFFHSDFVVCDIIFPRSFFLIPHSF